MKGIKVRFYIVMILGMLFMSSTVIFAETRTWIEKGFGKSKEDALFNAKWSVITKAMEKTLGDQSQNQNTITIIKKKFLEDETRYLRDMKILHESEEAGQYVINFKGTVEMATIRTDTKEFALESAAHRERPTISVKSHNKSVEGELMKMLEDYGYEVVDYESKMAPEREGTKGAGMRMNASDEGRFHYRVEIPVVEFSYGGKDAVTGQDAGSLHFQVKIIDTSNAAKVLATVQETVQGRSNRDLEKYLIHDVVKIITGKVNSQIKSTWEKAKSKYVVHIKNMDRKSYREIVKIFMEVTGDSDPQLEQDKAIFKLQKKIDANVVFNIEDKLEKAVGKLSEDSKVSNNKAVIIKM